MPYKDPEKQRSFQAQNYRDNREKWVERRKKNRPKNRKKNLEWALSIKKPCIYCGESHPATLQWHHRDPSTKEYEVSQMVRWSLARERILAEIQKCDSVCANCHAILHYKE